MNIAANADKNPQERCSRIFAVALPPDALVT
jgi:hypothetical protein